VKDKILELESVRGLAALMVVLFHTPAWYLPLFEMSVVRNGFLMVHLFFVLSGFVIYKAYGTRLHTAMDVMKFQALRFGRLYPIHILFLLVFVGIEGAKYVAATTFGMNLPNAQPFQNGGVAEFIQTLFLVQSLGFTENAKPFNFPSWSISVEFYTYILFALVTLLAPRGKTLVYAVLAILALLAVALLREDVGNFIFILHCVSGFFLGCLVCQACDILRGADLRLPAIAPLAVVGLIFVYLWLKPEGEHPYDYDLLIFPLTAMLIFALQLSVDNPLSRLLRVRTLAWLGTISYSIYMSHAALIWIVNQFIRVVLKRSEISLNGLMHPQLTAGEAVLAYGALFALVIGLSSLTFLWIENPLREAARRKINFQRAS
jgi:peptidoglycan/LPS O-acetylase OafA/YrhL